jgi:multicomponent Na+:H+ antiporter subunit D
MMSPGFWLPLAIVASSLVTGVAIMLLREEQSRLRTVFNLAGAIAKLVLVGIVLTGVLEGRSYEARFQIVLGFDFLLRVDLLALLFTVLSSVLWFVTTLYAIGYLEGTPNRRRFFSFFSLCVTASVGVALAGNLITFFIFYEFLTLATYPLVVHRGTAESLRAGRTYLSYTLAGGTVLFVGVVWLHTVAGPFDFGETHVLAALAPEHHGALTILLATLLLGLGVKAALVPLHGWLPVAMVAPAPVSALLHAVAVVKAGAFGIVRVVYDVFGLSLAAQLEMLLPLGVMAAITIIYGSLRALTQDDLKKRLAYSTVSQLSYIALGVAIFGSVATIGALLHLVHQGVMKITLFFCAGNFGHALGVHKVSEMAGVGRRMPLTMAAFSIAALAMIGVPPLAGFISKWYLALGGLAAGQWWVVVVLLISTVLNAGYFLPILHAAWFKEPDMAGAGEPPAVPRGPECAWLLLVPPLVTALLAVAVGVFASSSVSPLSLAREISAGLYEP